MYYLMLLFISFSITAQNYKITYETIFTVNLDTLKVTETMKDYYIKQKEKAKRNVGVLHVGTKQSSFQIHPIVHGKVVAQDVDLYTVYYDITQKKLIRKYPLEPSIWSVFDVAKEYKWEITNQTKIINGYTCYLARTSFMLSTPSNYLDKQIFKEVWFCPEFPYATGPSDFVGVPGLVFEAYNVSGNSKFILKKIEKSQDQLPIFPKEVVSLRSLELKLKTLYGSDTN